jgi:hypothetical protein
MREASELPQGQAFYSLEDFAKHHRIGLSTVYGEIRSGRLLARKIGRRTVIASADARAWTDQLPRVRPRTTADVDSDGGGANTTTPALAGIADRLRGAA